MTETLIVILILFFFVLLMGAWNGFVIRWDWAEGEEKKQLSTVWHIIGFVIRALPLVPVWWYFWGQWWDLVLISVLYCNFSYTVYDATIALIFNKPIWYTGNTSEIDKWGKIMWVFKGLMFLAIVPIAIIYFN